jgi:DNA-binding CsgD family transcriptional regulator/tetratricopeptide (TPR) repeat protein
MDRPGRPEPTPELVGRDSERDRVDAFIDSVSAGAHAFVVRGEPGIGKTALWRYALRSCRERGYEVLRTRPAEEEMPLPLVGLTDLLEPLNVDLLTEGSDALARGRLVLDALREAAARSPTILAIDDLQWLDSGSAQALRYVLRRLDAEPIGVVATARAGADPDPLALSRSIPQERLEVLELGPLGESDLRRLLSGTLSSISRPVLRRIHEVSGGNPLYAIELARGLQPSGGTPDGSSELRLPDSLQAAIKQRVGTTEPDLAELLATVSALGPTSVGELRANMPDADLDGLIDRAVRRELLVLEDDLSVRFSHPLVGSVVYAEMGPLERRRLHAELGSKAGDPDVRARHLARSIDRPDTQGSRDLEAAAERAASRGSFDLAAEFAGHALRVTPPDDVDDAFRRALLEIDSLAAAGEVSRALDRSDSLLASLPPGKRRAEAIVRRDAIEDDDAETAARLLEEALDQAGDDESLQGRVLELLGRTRRLMGDLTGALDCAERALALAERAGDLATQMSASANLGYTAATAGTPRPELTTRSIELERGLGTPLLTTSPRMLLAKQLLWSGDLAASRAICEAVLEEAARAGNHHWREQALYDLSFAAIAAGDFVEAEGAARQGIEAARDAEEPYGERLTLLTLALVLTWVGPRGEAWETAERCRVESEANGERPGIVRALGVLGLLALSEGDAAGAAHHLTSAADLLEWMGYANPGAFPVLPDAVEALAASSDSKRAGELLGRLEHQAEAVDGPWARAAARRARGAFLLFGGDADGAVDVLVDAASGFDDLGFRPDAARALLLQGRALLRAGHRTRAAEVLADARSRFAGLGAVRWQARAAEDVERASPGRAAGVLTRAEERVAALVARGLRNREIAGELFMSVATVEAHLTRIYRKLDIRSRSDLARLVTDGSLELEVDASPQGRAPDR